MDDKSLDNLSCSDLDKILDEFNSPNLSDSEIEYANTMHIKLGENGIEEYTPTEETERLISLGFLH